MNSDAAFPDLDPIESKDATAFTADYVRARERAAIEADRRLYGRPIDPAVLKAVVTALRFYAEEKEYDSFSEDVARQEYGQEIGSSLGSDRGSMACEALILLTNSQPKA